MNISDIAKKAAAKLPPDVLAHPMPYPDRLDYAEKIIQEAIDAATRETQERAEQEHEKYIIEKGLARIYDAERTTALRVLAELNHRVHSGYDWNADPDYVTLLVGAALNRERLPERWAAGAGVWRCAPSAEKETNAKSSD